MDQEVTRRDYRSTVHLPVTGFSMKADLVKREPEIVATWREQDVYHRRLEMNAAGETWTLHDGPPYANGNLHMGHFLNMVLKDMLVKIALIDGKRAKFVPGWDMHGLPIELETLKSQKVKRAQDLDPETLRALCKERAEYWLDKQRTTRLRMGAFGEFDSPYRTVDPSFEFTIVTTLAELAEQGQIHNALRPTPWCVQDETALAQYETEHEPKTSTSLYVLFPLSDTQRTDLLARMGTSDAPSTCSILVWTTTPWTLPGNVALAVGSNETYGLYDLADGRAVVVAESLAAGLLPSGYRMVGSSTGENLVGLNAQHPLLDRMSPVVTANHVEASTGTGIVHIAPGHGVDDFATGSKHNLPVRNPVGPNGVFNAEADVYAGLHIWKCESRILEDLTQRGNLWSASPFEHSYPHCWRCHKPVIYRATQQWFIDLDANDLRDRALRAAEAVEYTPSWGRERMLQMIETHPAWCISRQRTWGTPIPSVSCLSCSTAVLDPRVARKAAARFLKVGAGAWWTDSVEQYLPVDFLCAECGGTTFEKEFNIVDIWFESGVTHLAVLDHANGLPAADLVIEGGDQFRGWFRSSLLTGTAMNGVAPYARILKNGWVNNEQGLPMSKSGDVGVKANEAMDKWGADVLRLWVASVEFTDDVRFGPNVAEQASRSYRNLRNRLRFLLGNLTGFSAEYLVHVSDMETVDAMACSVADTWGDRVYSLYRRFEINDAYREISEFENEDMSGFYFDLLKDRLYCGTPKERNSARSALLHVFKVMCAVLSPIIPFTSEEAWGYLDPSLKNGVESVFFLESPVAQSSASSLSLWEVMKAMRVAVSARKVTSKTGLTANVRLNESFKHLIEQGFDVSESIGTSTASVLFSEILESDLSLNDLDYPECPRCKRNVEISNCQGVCERCYSVVLF